jgi:sigma-E factor negative regulatory protein RseA
MKPHAQTEPQAPSSSGPDDSAKALLSAAADGQADALPAACGLWRADAGARRTWHTYHLIGDVLRSEELASAPARDEAFVLALRGRLAAEPALLAPTPMRAQAAPRQRQRWLVPATVAAGLVAVAGVLVVARIGLPGAETGGATLAAASAAGLTLVGSVARTGSSASRLSDGTLIRDARLDEYLRAHQAARGAMAVAAPGGLMRQVDVVALPVGQQR